MVTHSKKNSKTIKHKKQFTYVQVIIDKIFTICYTYKGVIKIGSPIIKKINKYLLINNKTNQRSII